MGEDDKAGSAGTRGPKEAAGKTAQRQARQAEALKRNLARRKAQARGRRPAPGRGGQG